MDDSFIIPLEIGQRKFEYPASLRSFGFTIKVEVDIDGTIVSFEPDEERNWRAVVGFDDVISGKKVNNDILKAIADFLASVTK